MACPHDQAEMETAIGADGMCPLCLSVKVMKMGTVLEQVAACFDALDPRQPSGLSDAETASVFNATRDAVRLALE